MSDGGGWIAVDLDGTLAHYESWGDGSIGDPIPAMVERVRAWLGAGADVRIFTARICPNQDPAELERQVILIREWAKEHLGQELLVTCVKDFGMVELWDDRAIRVQKNVGTPCCNPGEQSPGEKLVELHRILLAAGQGRMSVNLAGEGEVTKA